jgi:hypothetical protein
MFRSRSQTQTRFRGLTIAERVRSIPCPRDLLENCEGIGDKVVYVSNDRVRTIFLIVIALIALPMMTLAQTDEIQVYDAAIEEPGVSADEMLAAVHLFYDQYYFRPRAVFRIVKKTAFDGHERKRLYKEAKSFLKLRAARNKLAKKHTITATEMRN